MKNIIAINGHYYFNMRSPLNLRTLINSAPPFIRFSLHTEKLKHALALARKIRTNFDEIVFEARMGFVTTIDDLKQEFTG